MTYTVINGVVCVQTSKVVQAIAKSRYYKPTAIGAYEVQATAKTKPQGRRDLCQTLNR